MIFGGVLSFFFLRLYRRSFDQIKYFRNERINIESKLLSLQLALLMANNTNNTNDYESLKEIIKKFVRTERNFVLKKGETTVEGEATKIQNKSDFSILEKILESFRFCRRQ